MRQRKFAALAVGLMIATTGIARANDQSGAVPIAQQAYAAGTATRQIGPADKLSPGNRLIAEALFAAQRTASTTWPLDRIAEARLEGQNWGEVFQQMKAENLLQVETLGQVVTWYQYNYVKPEPNPSVWQSSVATFPASERTKGN